MKRFRTTAVKAGNGIGKSYLAAGIVLWFALAHAGCKAVVAAPTQAQLSGVLWSELSEAHKCAAERGFPLGGRLRSLSYELGYNWRVEGFGTGSVESKSGRHSQHLLALVDEASGVPEPVMEAIDSLNPSRKLYFGNPLRPEGKFFEVCEQSGDNPHVNVITIPSLESPHIDLARSPVGMADATWLEDSRHQYGEDSIWWLAHVLARFPGEISEGLLPIPWLNLAGQTIHVPAGERWIGVDLGEGNGGDPTEIVCRDDNGILDWEASNRWGLETAAERVAEMARKHEVHPSRIVFDQAGIGVDFDNRLRTAGLSGCKPYKGSLDDQSGRFSNLRAAAAWRLRQRLDPNRTHRTKQQGSKFPLWVPQAPFALRPDLLSRYRTELQGVRYKLLAGDEIALEPKDEFVKRLKKSPNFLDALCMTYAFPFV